MNVADHANENETQVNSTALLDGLLQVSQLVRLRLNEWLGQFDLNEGRYAVLSAVSKADERGYSQAELAKQLSQSASNISTLIERMASDGLVIRLQSDADRRKRVVSITEMGRSKLDSVDANRSEWARRLLSRVATTERPNVYSFLERFGTSLDPSFAMPKYTATHPLKSSEFAALAENENQGHLSDDPRSPQFALREMLSALSSSARDEFNQMKDAA